MGGIVRFLIVALGMLAISISASAMPLFVDNASPSSFAIRTDDTLEDSFPSSYTPRPATEPPRVRPDDCQRYGLQYRHGDCLPWERKVPSQVKAPQKPVAAKAKTVRTTQAGKHLGNTAPVRAMTDQERAFQAAKPLILPASRVIVTGPKPQPAEMPLRALVGQLLLSGFIGSSPADADVARVAGALHEGRLTGVIISDANISGSEQLRNLLLKITKDSGPVPPILAIEQPGGPDSALSEDKGFSFYAAPNAVSSERNPYEAQLLYRDMAGELSSLGINLNIGPSADVCRDEGVDLSASCFGTAASRVAAFAAAFNFGHHDRGVMTALRHVPFRVGLQPSWRTEPANTAIMRSIIKTESSDALVIRAKVMDPLPLAEARSEYLSRQGASELRRSTGFQGVLIVDLDLGLSGAPVRYGEAIVKAFQSGADIVLVRQAWEFPGDFSSTGARAVEEGVNSGRLSKARIEDAYRHVQRLKDRLRGLQSRMRMAEIFGR